MKIRKVFFVLFLLMALFACNRDPNVAKRKYVESGNKYFANGKFKQASIMYKKALTKDQKYAEAYYRLGLSELQLKNPPAAANALRRAVELDPANEDASAKLADLYIAAYLSDSRRPPALLNEAREIAGDKKGLLKINPRSFQGLRIMGLVALVENDVNAALERFRAANEVKPFQPDVVLAYTRALIASKQPEEAERLGLSLLEKQPQAAPMYDLLYAHYRSLGRTADAEAILRKKVDNNPKSATPLVQLAGHYYLSKNEAEVSKTLDRILSNKTDFPLGHMHVGDFYVRVKNLDMAIRAYEGGLNQAADEQQKSDYKKRLIMLYAGQNRKKEAVQLSESVLAANPKDTEALAMRASLSLQGGTREQIQAAINDLNSAVVQQPRNFVLRYDIGRAHLAKGDVEQARTQFQEAIKLRPDYIPPKLALARINLARGEYTRAQQTANEVLALDPNSLYAKLIRSTALIGSGDAKQARAELDALVKEKPDSADAQFQLAMLNFSERRYKEAEDIFRKLREQNPGDPRGLMGIVETHMALGREAQAIQMLEEVVRNFPERPDYRLALANISVRTKRYDAAIQEYLRVLEKNPRAADVHLRLGETFRRKEDSENAKKHFEKAKELTPNDPLPSIQLALLLDAGGQDTEARPIYEHVLKLDPDNPIALNNLAYMMAESGADLDQALTLATRAKQKAPANPEIADTLGWIYIKKNLSDNAISIFRELTAKHSTSPTFQYHLGMALYQKGDKPQAKKALEAALKNKPSREEEGKIRELMGKIG